MDIMWRDTNWQHGKCDSVHFSTSKNGPNSIENVQY